MASHDNTDSVKMMVSAVKGLVKVKGSLRHRPVVTRSMELLPNITYSELQSKVAKKLKLSNQIGRMYYFSSSHQIKQAVDISDDEDVKIFMDMIREKPDDLVTLYVVEFVPASKWAALFKRSLSFSLNALVFFFFFVGFIRIDKKLETSRPSLE